MQFISVKEQKLIRVTIESDARVVVRDAKKQSSEVA